MNLDDAMTRWRGFKDRTSDRRHLLSACTVEHGRGAQWVHPGNYAFVRFACAPSQRFSLEFREQWPAHLEVPYVERLRDAMTAAVVDVLASSEALYVGCRVTCMAVRWDDVESSEMAFYRAAKAAISEVREKHEWGHSFVPK